MKKPLFLLTVLISIASSPTMLKAQGCSDAGFCTMGAMRPSQIYTKTINFKLRSLEVSYYNGKTTLSPKVNVATADFNFGITEKTTFQLKVPYQWVTGNLGETSGLSDISFSATHNVYSTENYHLNATIGGKIPTNKSDLEASNDFTGEQSVDLPMYYQTSLGSFDVVAGASLITEKWMFATGVQIALTENSNDFKWSEWQNYPDMAYLQAHPRATDLKRGIDVMMRIERAFHFSNVDIRIGLLPIYRVSRDKIKDINVESDTFGEHIKVENTTGLALSALLNASYHFNTQHSVKLLYGIQLADREVNPDGLTRTRVASLAYVIRF